MNPKYFPLSAVQCAHIQYNPLCTNGFFLLVCYDKFGIVHCIYQGYNFNKIVLLAMKIVSVLANSEIPDKMLHNLAFHLGLHCLPKICNVTYIGVTGKWV